MRNLLALLLITCALTLAPANVCAQASGAARSSTPQTQDAPAPRSFNDPNAPAGWKRYELQVKTGSVMSIFLPSLSEVTSNQFPMGAGSATNYMYTASTPTDIYVVSYLAGLPSEVTNNPQMRATLFEGFWRGFAEGVKRTLERNGLEVELVTQPPRKKMVGAFESQQQEFAIGTMQGTVQAVISGGYGYAIVALSLEKKPGTEHNSFLNSFSLRAPR